MRIEDSSRQRDALPIGMAKLTRLAFAGIDLGQIAERLLGMFERDPCHAGALMDLSTIDQLNGNLSIGMTRQMMALSKQRVFRSTCCGVNARLRVLAFVAAADMDGNTPLEFLLEGSDIALTMAYVLPGRPLPTHLPEHDLAFVAVAATSSNRTVLAELEQLLDGWPAPVINPPNCIARLNRCDGPTNSTSVAYLGKEQSFDMSPFVDCRGSDGLYRTFRIFFIDRRPYACHLTLSDGRNGTSLDAWMEAGARRRREEETFFKSFDDNFVRRHEAAFAELVERINLTYFGIDCAETSTGELVVFEVDHTLLVHDMDPVDIFPYKPAQMRKIFDAFSACLYRAADERSRGRRRVTP